MIKIIVIGDMRVGKTSLRKQFVGEGFHGTYTPTLGAEFSTKKVLDKNVTVFDLGGDQQSKLFRTQYYPGAHGILVVFDIANRESFVNLETWFSEIKSYIHGALPIFILGNKEDLRNTCEDPITEIEAYDYAQTKSRETNSSVSFLSTSALTGYNVEVAFTKLISEIEFG